MLHITSKTFQELSIDELYAILQLRSAVFVVEQNCVYQDLDGADKKAIHVIGMKNNNVVAYARVFGPGDYFSAASIGRVMVRKPQRKYGYGIDIMRAAIKEVESRFNESPIHLSAQAYLKKFYNSLGFEQVGKGYLEDGIPHIGMVKK